LMKHDLEHFKIKNRKLATRSCCDLTFRTPNGVWGVVRSHGQAHLLNCSRVHVQYSFHDHWL
jgi:hypothetical protein